MYILRHGLQILAISGGKTFALKVYANQKIADVKKTIQKRPELSHDEYEIQLNGEILEDHRTVGECLITETSVIHIVPRMKLFIFCYDLIRYIFLDIFRYSPKQ